jgi:putative membrane protein insertion efficiency factor
MRSGVKIFLKSSFANSVFVMVKITKRIFMMPEGTCRYTPTCSHYSRDALRDLPFYRAIPLIFKRVTSCHPRGGFGHDPVPTDTKNSQ